MKSVLAVLVNFGNEQLKYLQKVVSELKSFDKYNVHVVVHSNIDLPTIKDIDEVKIISEVELRNLLLESTITIPRAIRNSGSIHQNLHNHMLPLTCKKTIWENKDNYDVFIFGENDHLFKQHHIDKHLFYTKILPKNRIAGLMQYEENEEGRFYPAYHENWVWDTWNVEIYNGLRFCHFLNIHQASFILTQQQLLDIGKKFDFTGYFGDDSYSTKCKVNTDIYEYCGMKKIICISEFEDNIIHHLPNYYASGKNGRHKFGASEETMQKDLEKMFDWPNWLWGVTGRKKKKEFWLKNLES